MGEMKFPYFKYFLLLLQIINAMIKILPKHVLKRLGMTVLENDVLTRLFTAHYA